MSKSVTSSLMQNCTDSLRSAAKDATQYFTESCVYYYKNRDRLKKELLSGLTVAILQVPEAVAFAFVAGMPPTSGLRSTFLLCFITAALGGKPGMISGSAGALAVVQAQLTADSGPLGQYSLETRREFILIVIVCTGMFQILAGALRLSRFVSMIPHSALVGFLNGLAVVIFQAQLTIFKSCHLPNFSDCSAGQLTWISLADGRTWVVLWIVFTTMSVVMLFPKIPKIGKLIPASLAALLTASLIEHGINRPFLKLDTRTVGDVSAISGVSPPFHAPDIVWNGSTVGIVLEYSAILAVIGLIESLMTLQVMNELTGDQPTSFAERMECVGQGSANFICGFFGAMGGCAMIGQSTINIMNGSRGRLAGMVAGAVIYIFIVAAGPAIEQLPVAALTGVLFMVVIHTFHWNTFRILHKIRRTDALTIALVTVLAVTINLAVAVVSGVVFTSLVNSWDSGKLLRVHAVNERNSDSNSDDAQRSAASATRVYCCEGALFFASARVFRNAFDIARDPAEVVIDFSACSVCDFSALFSINEVVQRYKQAGKTVSLRQLNAKALRRVHKLYGSAAFSVGRASSPSERASAAATATPAAQASAQPREMAAWHEASIFQLPLDESSLSDGGPAAADLLHAQSQSGDAVTFHDDSDPRSDV